MYELNIGLTVIGALSIDTIKTPAKTVRNVFGGSAGYAAVAASFFTNVNLVSNIGNDYPTEFIKLLAKCNINTNGVRRVEGLSSHFEVCYNEELSSPTYEAIELNVLNDRLVIPEFARNTKYVYLATNDPEIQLSLIEKLSSAQLVATDTHSTWIKSKYDCVKDVMERVDIMFMDDNEVCLFGRKQRLRNAAGEILKLGVSKLVVKKREHGAILFADGRMYPAIGYDTYDMMVADPTGYGGTLAGSFIGVLAENDVRAEKLNNIYLKALAIALVVASFKIEDFSIFNLLRITKEDIWRRYDRFRDMLSL